MVNPKKQKGISVIYIILIASVIFAIALGINSISYQQAKTMTEMGFSLIALDVADTGAELQLQSLYKGDPLPTDPLNGTVTLPGGKQATYNIITRCSQENTTNCFGMPVDPGCAAPSYYFCINSVGTFSGTRRAIELKY